jgi:transcriptional regulator GlxA family with amidase domain
VSQITSQAGYASATTFREQFTARRGVPPSDYRSAFKR